MQGKAVRGEERETRQERPTELPRSPLNRVLHGSFKLREVVMHGKWSASLNSTWEFCPVTSYKESWNIRWSLWGFLQLLRLFYRLCTYYTTSIVTRIAMLLTTVQRLREKSTHFDLETYRPQLSLFNRRFPARLSSFYAARFLYEFSETYERAFYFSRYNLIHLLLICRESQKSCFVMQVKLDNSVYSRNLHCCDGRTGRG